jgi:hypothetical protein
MKDQATLLAIGGVVVITLGVIILSGFTKQSLDSELVKQVVTGLVGFASGAAVATSVVK